MAEPPPSAHDTAPILIVDDDSGDALLAVRILKGVAGTRPIVVVPDGAEALDVLLGRGRFAVPRVPAPALVLLDLDLPKVDGFRVLSQIRGSRELTHVPVVVFTASDRREDVTRAYAVGANSVVRKASRHLAFEEQLRGLAVYWLRLNARP